MRGILPPKDKLLYKLLFIPFLTLITPILTMDQVRSLCQDMLSGRIEQGMAKFKSFENQMPGILIFFFILFL